MQSFFRSKKRILLLTMTTVLLIVFLSDCAVDAAVAGQRISDIKDDSVLTSPAHNIVKRHFKFYDDKKYGDGSLKKFFIMLKIILTLFGKH